MSEGERVKVSSGGATGGCEVELFCEGEVWCEGAL